MSITSNIIAFAVGCFIGIFWIPLFNGLKIILSDMKHTIKKIKEESKEKEVIGNGNYIN